MNKSFVYALATAVGVTGFAQAAPQASAAEAAPASSIDQVRAGALAAMRSGDLQQVGKHGGKHGGKGGKYGRHYGGNYGRHYGGDRYSYGRRHHRGYGGAIAAGALGLAAGAIIAGGANRSYARGSSDCAERFRTYDARSGTYIGTGGVVRHCP